jgi:hypothetical protein
MESAVGVRPPLTAGLVAMCSGTESRVCARTIVRSMQEMRTDAEVMQGGADNSERRRGTSESRGEKESLGQHQTKPATIPFS